MQSLDRQVHDLSGAIQDLLAEDIKRMQSQLALFLISRGGYRALTMTRVEMAGSLCACQGKDRASLSEVSCSIAGRCHLNSSCSAGGVRHRQGPGRATGK